MKDKINNSTPISSLEIAREIAEKKWLDWGAQHGWPRIVLMKPDYIVPFGEDEWRKYIAEASMWRIENSLRALEYEDW